MHWTEGIHYAERQIWKIYETNLALKENMREQNVELPLCLDALVKAQLFFEASHPEIVNIQLNAQNALDPKYIYSEKCQEIILDIAERTLSFDLSLSVRILSQLYEHQNQKTNSTFNFFVYAINFQLFLHRTDYNSAKFMLEMIDTVLQQTNNPLFVSKSLQYRNQYLIKTQNYSEAHTHVLRAIDFNQRQGYVKQNLLRELFNLAILKYKAGDFYNTLIVLERIKKKSKEIGLTDSLVQAKIYKILILMREGVSIKVMAMIKSNIRRGAARQ